MTTFFSLSDLGLSSSAGQLLTNWLSYMQTVFPGYTPNSGNLEYILAVIFASWAADVNAQATQGSKELFKQFGQQLIGVQPQLGTSATTIITVTAIDTQGYTLPAGTQLLLDNAFGFQTLQTLTIPAGSQSGTVIISATTPGSSFNGAGSVSGAVLNQQLNWVLSVGLQAPASGGTDPETEDAYLNRLAAELTLMAPRPITASDYSTLVLDFQPVGGTDQEDVGRATAIDGYDANPLSPTYNTYNNERMVAVCVTDSSGNALNTDTMYGIGGTQATPILNSPNWGVVGWLQSLREVNFIINVVAPNYSPIYVACSVFRQSNYTAATVQMNVQAALIAFLSPATWGMPPGGGVGWNNQPTIYQSAIENAVQNAAGVDHIVTGTLGMGFGASPSPSINDLLMPGPFPLPTTTNGATIPLTAITVVN